MSPLNDPVARAGRAVENPDGGSSAVPLVVAIALTKGGVGKTTTAVSLAGAASVLGVRALVVDVDTQGQAAHALGVPKDERGPGLAGVVAGTATVTEAIVEARPPTDGQSGVYVLPGGAALATEGARMAADPATGMLAVRRAAHAAADAVGARIVVVDTPPGWGALSLGALAAADVVLCPVAPHPLAVEAVAEFDGHLESVQEARAAFGGAPLPRLAFVLPTMYDGRANSPTAALGALRTWATAHRDRPAVLDPIPYTVRVQEAPAFGEILAEYAPGHPAAAAYAAAAGHVLALDGTL